MSCSRSSGSPISSPTYEWRISEKLSCTDCSSHLSCSHSKIIGSSCHEGITVQAMYSPYVSSISADLNMTGFGHVQYDHNISQGVNCTSIAIQIKYIGPYDQVTLKGYYYNRE
eukprot:688633_1